MRWTGRVIVLAASPSPVNFGGQTGLNLQRAAHAVLAFAMWQRSALGTTLAKGS
jgi:hypothetical protein